MYYRKLCCILLDLYIYICEEEDENINKKTIETVIAIISY